MPEEISSLSELRVLALDNNDLKTVPKSIGTLLHLQSLLLRFVPYSTVAERVGMTGSVVATGLMVNTLYSIFTVNQCCDQLNLFL